MSCESVLVANVEKNCLDTIYPTFFQSWFELRESKLPDCSYSHSYATEKGMDESVHREPKIESRRSAKLPQIFTDGYCLKDRSPDSKSLTVSIFVNGF